MAPASQEYLRRRDLAFLLAAAARRLNEACDARMRPLGLTRSQWLVIAYVSRVPGINQRQLAREADLGVMAVTGLLDRMQAKGLIERRPQSADRRANAVHLTPRSRALVRRMNAAAARVLEDVFEPLSTEQIDALAGVLTVVKGRAETAARAGRQTDRR